VPWLKKLKAAMRNTAKTRTGQFDATAGQNAGLRALRSCPRVADQTGDSSTRKKMNTAKRTGATPIANIPRQPRVVLNRPKTTEAIRYPRG
jgi:hypothetical protein